MTSDWKTNGRGRARKKVLSGLLFLVGALAGCAPRQETFQGEALGTTYLVLSLIHISEPTRPY